MKVVGLGGFELLLVAIFIVVIVVWFMSIYLFVEILQKADCPKSSGFLLFFGVFASPVMLGLYACAYCAFAKDALPKKPENDLPPIV